MASREQCEKALQAKLQSRQDVMDFSDAWGGGVVTNNWPDDVFIAKNIQHVLDETQRLDGGMDRLGVKLGLATDAEQQRLAAEASSKAASESAAHAGAANRISRRALGGSAFAIIIAVVSLILQFQEGCGWVGGRPDAAPTRQLQ